MCLRVRSANGPGGDAQSANPLPPMPALHRIAMGFTPPARIAYALFLSQRLEFVHEAAAAIGEILVDVKAWRAR